MNKKYINVSNAFQLAGVLALYALQFSVLFPMRFMLRGESGTDVNLYLVLGCMIFALIFGILGVVFSIVAGVKKETPTPVFTMVIKLAMIPFFIVNFLFWAFFFLGTLNPFLMVATPFVFLIGTFLTYLVLLMTSLPITIVTLSELKLYKNCPKTLFIWGLVLNFFFVLDVIGAFLIVLAYKKADP